MKKSIILVCGLSLLTFINTALAVCPICTFVVGAGIGLSEWLGIDDTITGLWVGGLLMSFIIWTIDFMDKKNIHFWGRKTLIVAFYYATTIVPLYYQKLLNHPLNKLWGINKLILGIIVGSVVFAISNQFYIYLKNHNGGKAYFPFQKVVMPVLSLAISSVVFYFITY